MLHTIKKFIEKQKVYFTQWLYLKIGTRVKVYDIIQDLNTIEEVFKEFCILLNIWNITKFDKYKILSINRLEACLRSLLKLKGLNWTCEFDKFQEIIEKYYNEKLDLYEEELFTENGETIPCLIPDSSRDINKLVLLISYIFMKENK